MSGRLLLDEHYGAEIAKRLRAEGHDVVAVVEDENLRAARDAELFRHAAGQNRRSVTENIKDFRPLLVSSYQSEEPFAKLLLVSPKRFPRGTGTRTAAIVNALAEWLSRSEVNDRPDEDWLQ